MGGLATFQAGLELAGEDQTIENETWTPDPGNVTALDESNRDGAYYTDNVSVYGEMGGEMEYGSDYIWYAGNGTVQAVQGGDLDGDAEATITYGYQQTTAEQRSLTELAAQVPRGFGFFVLFIPVLLLLLFVTG